MKQVINSSILYVEDDEIEQGEIARFLKTQCKNIYTAPDGQAGFELYKQFKPDIVISDIEMPRINGLELARKIREHSLLTQIIIITAHKNPKYLFEAANLQLVQYIIKPLSREKITAALNVASNFLNNEPADAHKKFSNSKYYNIYTKELYYNNNVVNLSKHERSLLKLFLEKHPAAVSYESINAKIYNNENSRNAMKLLIHSLRNKIDKASIINVPGFGYKLNVVKN